ncbi:hypothetical protein BU104_12635 [Staphylococcus xylosus]|uniref:Uncharacterized protein n=1 Tax=Staphylococcus xylosus TaxID=1288 RepID=A0AAQ0LWM9_STAXY|nr:hypothetical protein [Staphylococcus xylosus]RIM90973.1 hypothetical protein BU104_12635 [Staphylococcus xylosus]
MNNMIDVLPNVAPTLTSVSEWLYTNFTLILILSSIAIGLLIICLILFQNPKITTLLNKLLIYVVVGLFTLSIFMLLTLLIGVYFESDTSNSDMNKTSKHFGTMQML